MKSHRGRKDQVCLQDRQILQDWMRMMREEHAQGPYLDVGTGRGAILRALPHPRAGVEVDDRFAPWLQGESVHWGDYLRHTQPYDARTVVGNLPFAQSVAYILKSLEVCPRMEQAWFVVQRQVAQRMIGKGRLGVLCRRLFEVRWCTQIAGHRFTPRVAVSGVILHLRNRRYPHASPLIRALRRIIQPRRILKSYYPLLPAALAHKRIDQLTPAEEQELTTALIAESPCPDTSCG